MDEITITIAIEALVVKAGEAKKSEEALRFSQSALNLAHTKAMLDNQKYYK